MASTSSAFSLLDGRIQRFIWAQGWEELREVQELSAPLVLSANKDVIIAAATAAGKTEAAFFPAITHILKPGSPRLIVYISPLKALINDQLGRLQDLCEDLGVPVWPWHGDVSATVKKRFMAKKEGILLITPESLEAMLCNKGSALASVFKATAYFIIDELHAFIGSERGKQLQSLMHRIELAREGTIPRIGLSATLGDMGLAAEFLRPHFGASVAVLEAGVSGTGLKILVKGYEEPLVLKGRHPDEEHEPKSPAHIASHLFKALQGTNNLVFPNSRREVERYTHLLSKQCELHRIPNEFWPHHGSLSKEIRSETEAALKQKETAASAICTNTLELGIDIGDVKCVAQIGPPPSVASLRQRLGRSGRRKGEFAILRGYTTESELGPAASLADNLRLDTVQLVAMVQLLLENWFEPPSATEAHYSTLVQQLLSVISQRGGASAASLYRMLCGKAGPFPSISGEEFSELLRHLGTKDLIVQESSGDLLHGVAGERYVNHYSFYAAFSTEEEFRLIAGGKTLGSLPVTQALVIGQRILFAGKTWRVDDVDDTQKTVYVSRKSGGAPPMFSGSSGRIHNRVRSRMRELLQSDEQPRFLDPMALRFLTEARKYYASAKLDSRFLIEQGAETVILTWLGDAANEALACLLRQHGLAATASGPGVEIQIGEGTRSIYWALEAIALNPAPDLDVLLSDVKNLQLEKWDWALPDALLRRAYASHNLDIEKALEWSRALARV
jgi:ATP-dependent helicase Lhr and Lhr-like helicase